MITVSEGLHPPALYSCPSVQLQGKGLGLVQIDARDLSRELAVALQLASRFVSKHSWPIL